MPFTRPEINRRYRQRNPDYWKREYRNRQTDPQKHQAVKARKRVGYAIATGKLKRKPCFKRTCPNERTEAHHYKGYAPQYALTVRFYCHLHHSQIEKQKNEP